MRRLYYIVDDIDTTNAISECLHQEGITDWNFHVLAKDASGLYRHNLHSALPLHRHDTVRFGERGALIGAVLSFGFGMMFYLLQLLPWHFDRFWVVLTVLAGVFLGALQGSVTGSRRENYKIEDFHSDIEAGRLLVMVDVRQTNKARVREVMNLQFPDVHYGGNDSTLISPFRPARRIWPGRSM
jgi:hypothetical protein